MTKYDLIERIARKNPQLKIKEIEAAVKLILDGIGDTLARQGRVEIRGFGSFTVRRRQPKLGRNPKTGESVKVGEKWIPHFKAGKALRERADDQS